MPRILDGPEFAKSYQRFALKSSLPWLCAFGFCWWRFFMQKQVVNTEFAFAAVIIGGLQLLVSHEFFKRSYRCPQCDCRIKQWRQVDEPQLSYVCVDCDVEWRVCIGHPPSCPD